MAELDRYIGYYEPYATSHVELDKTPEMLEETRNVARVLAKRIAQLRGGVPRASEDIIEPRPK